MRSESTSADAVDRYLAGGPRQVQGWLQPEAALRIADLVRGQFVTGAIGEIGVHHGKLFVLLALLRREGEAGLAVDVFEEQEHNVDGGHTGWRCTVAPFFAAPHVILRRQSARARRTDQIREWGKRVPYSAPAVRRVRKGVRK